TASCLVARMRVNRRDAPPAPTRKMRVLHNTLTQHLVLSGEQILHKIVTGFIGIARGAGEMLIDSHARRVAEIIRDGKNFVSRFTLVEQPLCIGTCCADRKQLRRDSDKSGKKQLLAIELRPESRHGMKQSACESLARARGVIDVLREYFV